MSEISKILGNLPDGEETRERVAEWLKWRKTGQGSEEVNSAGPLKGGQHDCPGESRGKNFKTVSLFQSSAGEVPPMNTLRRTLLGLTASCRRSKGHKGPTASSSWSCVQSSASQVSGRTGVSKGNKSSRSTSASREGRKRAPLGQREIPEANTPKESLS